ncbi:hypothetical protein Acr_00g0026720 [Actinidia rufa]|uniref:Uncharacterized protein n=1 Tax=Actinidia rufa TaxID=165716 RepID=A0A7J0DF35_9ERIC|nr:hypothetical protein Acr_00g0026720 [Actinidia rufa]
MVIRFTVTYSGYIAMNLASSASIKVGNSRLFHDARSGHSSSTPTPSPTSISKNHHGLISLARLSGYLSEPSSIGVFGIAPIKASMIIPFLHWQKWMPCHEPIMGADSSGAGGGCHGQNSSEREESSDSEGVPAAAGPQRRNWFSRLLNFSSDDAKAVITALTIEVGRAKGDSFVVYVAHPRKSGTSHGKLLVNGIVQNEDFIMELVRYKLRPVEERKLRNRHHGGPAAVWVALTSCASGLRCLALSECLTRPCLYGVAGSLPSTVGVSIWAWGCQKALCHRMDSARCAKRARVCCCCNAAAVTKSRNVSTWNALTLTLFWFFLFPFFIYSLLLTFLSVLGKGKEHGVCAYSLHKACNRNSWPPPSCGLVDFSLNDDNLHQKPTQHDVFIANSGHCKRQDCYFEKWSQMKKLRILEMYWVVLLFGSKIGFLSKSLIQI